MTYHAARGLDLLRQGTGQRDAPFRDGQEEAIQHIVDGRGRLLVVQKTGWGKSFVYFIAAKLLREAGNGPALLISPLLALMRNQILAAERMGTHAVTINSDNRSEWDNVEERLKRDDVDVLLISPERLANERFRTEVLGMIAGRISLLIVDEAHCISDWGHDFRPQYRLLERAVRTLPPNVRLLATTATANDRVLEDLRDVLGPNLEVSRGDLNRPSLTLQTMRLPSQAERLAWLAERIPYLEGTGIIYTLTVRDALQVTAWLKSRGLEVEAYTGETGDLRPELENALLENRVKALVATTALGMGFDKPDLSFVIHYQAPGSVVGYYQQVGRAGRALATAYGVLLSGTEEDEIIDYFIDAAFPTREEVRNVLVALEGAPDGLSLAELQTQVNVGRSRLEKAILLLALESPAPIAKAGTKWQLTAARLDNTFWDRAGRLTDLRRQEHRQMQEYIALESGHMDFLIQALDGEPRPLDASPSTPVLPTTVDDAIVAEAIAFLRRSSLPIQPRKKWPGTGMPSSGQRGRIPEGLQASQGRALCVWGDAGWGGSVRHGKYMDGRFADRLVEACRDLVVDWKPAPAPTWVTCVPSLRHPNLVPDFARRLATALGLEFRPVLDKTDERPEQKSMANSAHQATNVDGSLVIHGVVPAEPVLLVDDMVDSRWTFTVAAAMLRSQGCGEVFPLALATTGAGT